ncbi:hypothetical protein BDZ89DRAFT_353257 [Hymenopellis radicata]|nr:hypothetical protein BDZ89DRAFT_353257 [Hymenopellis radicata]
MFRAVSRPLFRISRAPSARCASQWSASRIPASTRSYSTPPQPSFASTVGKRGWWQRAWFRDDGTPRSKRKGALYALLASVALVPIPVLMYALLLTEEHSFIAWSLVQCYRTDARYDQVNWDDLDSVVDYFRDLVIVLLVNHHEMDQDQVDMVFDRVKLWGKEDPAPSSESAPESRVLITKRIFTRAAHDVHLLLNPTSDGKTKIKVGVELVEFIDRPAPATVGTLAGEFDLGLVETGFWAVMILHSAMVEWAAAVDRVSGGEEKLLELDSSKVERLKADAADWETVD